MMKIIVKLNFILKLAIALSPSFVRRIHFLVVYFLVVFKKNIGLGWEYYRLYISVNDKVVELYVFDPTDFAVLKEIFIDREYDIVLAKQPGVILDIGSNVGYSVLYFRILFPNAVIHAYEPEPQTFKKMLKNIENIAGVFAHNMAISNINGSAEFFVYPGSSMSSSFVKRSSQSTRISVPAIKLDDAIVGAGGVDLIKYDVEGAEFLIFSSSEEYKKVCALIGEFHEDLTGKLVSDFMPIFENYSNKLLGVGTGRFIVTSTSA